MLNRLRSKQLGKRMGKYKIIIMQFLIVGLALSFAACSMFEGLGGTKPKVETPPPKPAEAPPVAPKPEAPLTPSTAPAVSAPKQAQPPGTPTAPPTEPKKEEVKPTPPPAPAEVYVITLKNSNVRAEADPKSKIITTLKKGTKVEKIGQSGNWVNVKLPSGESGHIFHELVKEVE